MNQPPPLPESRGCSRCGTSIQADANFCHACGAPAQKLPAPPQSLRQEPSTLHPKNKSDTPIGNIIFSTRYADRHGNILQFHNGESEDVNKLGLGIDGPIKAHSSKTFTVLDDITEPKAILDAEKASFTIVGAGDWMQ